MKKIFFLCLLLTACTTSNKSLNPLSIGERLQAQEKIVLADKDIGREMILSPYDRNIGAHPVMIRDYQDPYNVIPLLVLDKATEQGLWRCREPFDEDCLELVQKLLHRLDQPYVIVKASDSLSAIAARECGSSKYVRLLREHNFPYGDCIGRADRNDQGLCISISSGTPIRIPKSCPK